MDKKEPGAAQAAEGAAAPVPAPGPAPAALGARHRDRAEADPAPQPLQALPNMANLTLNRDVFFYGEDYKGGPGAVSVMDLVQIVDARMLHSGWSELEATRYFRGCLRDRASRWFKVWHMSENAAKDPRREEWTYSVRPAFLKHFSPEEADTTLHLHDIGLQPGESPKCAGTRILDEAIQVAQLAASVRPPATRLPLSPEQAAIIARNLPDPQMRNEVYAVMQEWTQENYIYDAEYFAGAIARHLIPGVLQHKHPKMSAALVEFNREFPLPGKPKSLRAYQEVLTKPNLINKSNVKSLPSKPVAAVTSAPPFFAPPDEPDHPTIEPVGRRPNPGRRQPKKNKPNGQVRVLRIVAAVEI